MRRPLMFLFVVGAFVSFTTAGRLVFAHVLFTMLAWSFLPSIQIAFVALICRRLGRPVAEGVDLLFMGQAPWLLLLLLLSGICLFSTNVQASFEQLLSPLLVLMLIALVWSIVLTYACFRASFFLTTRRALGATAFYYFGISATLVTYYTAVGQLPPLIL